MKGLFSKEEELLKAKAQGWDEAIVNIIGFLRLSIDEIRKTEMDDHKRLAIMLMQNLIDKISASTSTPGEVLFSTDEVINLVQLAFKETAPQHAGVGTEKFQIHVLPNYIQNAKAEAG